jgi:hypothetical protein
MEQSDLDQRHRYRNGEIARVYGNAHIGDLRNTYGPGFARGIDDSEKLIDVLHQIDDASLRHLVHDHGKLLEGR